MCHTSFVSLKKIKKVQVCDHVHKFDIVTICDRHICHKMVTNSSVTVQNFKPSIYLFCLHPVWDGSGPCHTYKCVMSNIYMRDVT